MIRPASPAIVQRLKKSDDLVCWVHSKLDGMDIPQLQILQLPDKKRLQLALACWHVAIDHSMAIVVLVHETLHGSALTLIRPLCEAYSRGIWLKHAATDEDIDRAGRDQFPRDSEIVTAIEKSPHFSFHPFSDLKNQSWKILCSFTHTGYQQIGARITPQGIGYDYQDSEILGALLWADMFALAAVGAFADVTENEPLAQEVLRQIKSVSEQ